MGKCNCNKEISFIYYKQDILDALNKKLKKLKFKEKVTLVNGFINPSIQEEIDGDIIGGTFIPMVAVVGDDTGYVHYFALKALLPNL